MAELASWATGSDTERIVDVEDARAALSAVLCANGGLAARAGFISGGADAGLVTASTTPDAEVHVESFQLVIPNSRGIFPYVTTLDSPQALDVLVTDPADPANTRHDLIVAQQSDAYYGDTDSLFQVRRVVGTASATPVDPDPAADGSPDYVTLARVTVTAGATAITSGMITDLRPADRTVASGGVLPCTSATRPEDPHDGMVIYETDTGEIRVWSATAATWAQVWTEVSGQMTTDHPVRVAVGDDVSLSSTGHAFQIGSSTATNLRADWNEIMVANNGSTAPLTIQGDGGLTQFGPDGIDCDGPAQFDQMVTVAPAEGAASRAIALNHGYGIYADNVNGVGGIGTRLWIDTPDNGDVTIGPRGGSDWINQLRLRTDSTTGNAANLYINPATKTISQSTSSLRYKTDVHDLDLDLDAIRALRPVRYRDRAMVESDPETTQTYIGLIAEEVHDLGLTNFVSYRDTEEGPVPDGVQYDRLVVAQHMLIGELEARLAEQETQLAALTARLDVIEGAQ